MALESALVLREVLYDSIFASLWESFSDDVRLLGSKRAVGFVDCQR